MNKNQRLICSDRPCECWQEICSKIFGVWGECKVCPVEDRTPLGRCLLSDKNCSTENLSEFPANSIFWIMCCQPTLCKSWKAKSNRQQRGWRHRVTLQHVQGLNFEVFRGKRRTAERQRTPGDRQRTERIGRRNKVEKMSFTREASCANRETSRENCLK